MNLELILIALLIGGVLGILYKGTLFVLEKLGTMEDILTDMHKMSMISTNSLSNIEAIEVEHMRRQAQEDTEDAGPDPSAFIAIDEPFNNTDFSTLTETFERLTSDFDAHFNIQK